MTDAYDPATRPCAHGPTPGCTSLQHATLGYWPQATNLGTFICRPTADGAPSVHGNGRAGDIGPGLEPCAAIAEWLVANHTVLGVQLVIWHHHIWTVNRADEGWRPYGCDKPGSQKDHHTTHVHWEINVDAGKRLTPGIIDAVLPHQPPQPQPTDEGALSMLPRCVQWKGAVFLVGYSADVFERFDDKDKPTGDMVVGAWRKTFPNPARLDQIIGGGGCVTDNGHAFKVKNEQFEIVYMNRGVA